MKKKENKRSVISNQTANFRLEEGKKIRDKMLNEKKMLEGIKN